MVVLKDDSHLGLLRRAAGEDALRLRRLDEKRKRYRAGPKLSSWPKNLTVDPY